MERLGFTVTDLIQRDDWPFGRTTTYSLLNSGKLPAKRCGGKTIILARDAEAMLNSLPDYPVKATA